MVGVINGIILLYDNSTVALITIIIRDVHGEMVKLAPAVT